MSYAMRIIWYFHSLVLVYILGCAGDSGPVTVQSNFNTEKDLLIAQYDCKTDVDDLHSVAAFATILADTAYAGINHHAVAGAYGVQDGLYVPPNDLFTAAFGNKWSDAHTDFRKALNEVVVLVEQCLDDGGDIWIAEAGQSDFTAAVVEQIARSRPVTEIRERFHVVQHSNWNEEVTAPEKLRYVKKAVSYHKIADGNVTGNGTPGFRTDIPNEWTQEITDPGLREIWNLAIRLGDKYNGKDGRYLNESISDGGLDFSDTSEIAWILGFDQISDASEFFQVFGRK